MTTNNKGERITVYQALVELKILKDRRDKILNGDGFVVDYALSSAKDEIKDISSIIESKYQRLNFLNKRIVDLRSLINESNANTMVEVLGKKMSVARAIAEKDNIENLKKQLFKMTSIYSNVKREVELMNEDVVSNAYDKISDFQFSEIDSNNYKKAIEDYVEKNRVELVDPMKIKKEIEKLSDYIDSFEAEIDTALTVSNATTLL